MREHHPSGCAVYLLPAGKVTVEHEVTTHCATAARLAALRGLPYAGIHDPGRSYQAPVYYIPQETIIDLRQAQALGISSVHDLFGGVVAQGFMATKAIAHPLVSPDASAPPGWSTAFGERVAECVLQGLTAFSREDAERGIRQLLKRGPVRIKPVRATAGRGQCTVGSEQEAGQALDDVDFDEVADFGLVLEEHLDEVATYSVGRVEVGGLIASYYGTQNLTRDNDGEQVYGGSELYVVRGGFEQLLGADVPDHIRTAIEQATAFDAAACQCLPGFLASRRNYDVAQGQDAHNRLVSGVLEQSWRIGGASSAEVAALEMFARDPQLQWVRAASIERYGAQHEVPAGASVLFRGADEQVGFITKCVTAEAHDDKKRSS